MLKRKGVSFLWLTEFSQFEIMPHKTNAARILDLLKIPYVLKEFNVDLEDLSAVHAAEMIGIEAEDIYKTIVLRGKTHPFLVAVLPSDAHIDLKKVARASGDKNCELIHVKELLQVTGYVRGGCSPVGMKKKFPTFIDTSAITRNQIFVSAGRRGLLMRLSPSDLAKACEAKFDNLVLAQ